jgi:ankyrin repeat protein
MGSIESKVKKNDIEWCIKHRYKTDGNNHNALHHAVFRNNKPLIELLVKRGCDINLIDNYKRTPLHIAIENSNLDIVEFLTEHNASLIRSNPNPIVYSIELNKMEIFKYLLTKITVTDHPSLLLFATQFNRTEIITLLLENGISINHEQKGNTALHIAANKGDFGLVRFLVEHGANTANTSLHYASNSDKKLNIVEYLVRHGADVNLKNNTGHTPVAIAMLYKAYNIMCYYQNTNIKHCPKCNKQSRVKIIPFEDKMECKICLEQYDEMIQFKICDHITCCVKCYKELR